MIGRFFMGNTIFTGAAVATITPFRNDGSVDLMRYADFVDDLIQNGADAIVVNGTTGEAATLSDEEQYNIICCVKDAVNRRVPLIAGAGSNNTFHAARLALNARNAGADAVLCVTPYYNKGNENGILEHFNFIADRANLPVILYNVPSRTGVNLKPEWIFRLADNPNIVAIKEASGNLSQVTKIRSLCGDRFDIYSGNDDVTVPVLSMGGKGVISVLGNLLPQAVHEICSLYFNGETAKAADLQIHLLPLIEALFSDVNPIPVKEALKLIGKDSGTLRLPLAPISVEKREALKKVLQNQRLL